MPNWPRVVRICLAVTLAAASLQARVALADARSVLKLLPGKPPAVYYFVRTDQPKIALTIDDTPDPRTTPRILDLLARQAVKATFFVITNRIPGNEGLLRRIVDDGHELGNHMTQDVRSIALSDEDFERRFLHAHQALSAFASVRWFRPGSGAFTEHMLQVLARHDYKLALGSVYPLDAHIESSRFAAWHIRTSTEPGSIIVLHDGGARGERTVQTLQQVLPELAAAGYTGVTLSELVALDRPGTEGRQATD